MVSNKKRKLTDDDAVELHQLLEQKIEQMTEQHPTLEIPPFQTRATRNIYDNIIGNIIAIESSPKDISAITQTATECLNGQDEWIPTAVQDIMQPSPRVTKCRPSTDH